MQALRDEFTSALSSSERSTESRLLDASSLAAEAADAATTAREVALVAAAEAQAALNATARLREAAEEDEARWRRRRLREEEVMAEAEIWREEVRVQQSSRNMRRRLTFSGGEEKYKMLFVLGRYLGANLHFDHCGGGREGGEW